MQIWRCFPKTSPRKSQGISPPPVTEGVKAGGWSGHVEGLP